MGVHRVKITAGGRIQLPAQLRKDLSLSDGATVNLELENGQIVLRKPPKTLAKIQARLAPFIEPGDSGTDTLKELRRNLVMGGVRRSIATTSDSYINLAFKS